MWHYFYLAVRMAGAVYILYKIWRLLFLYRLFGFWEKMLVKRNKQRPSETVKSKVVRRIFEWVEGVRSHQGKKESEKLKLGRVKSGNNQTDSLSIMGRAKIVLLDDPRKVASSVAATDLEPTGFIGRDEPARADDVESSNLRLNSADIVESSEPTSILIPMDDVPLGTGQSNSFPDKELPLIYFDDELHMSEHPNTAGTREQTYIPSDEELYKGKLADENEISSGVAFEDLAEVADVLLNGSVDDDRRAKAAKTLYDIQNTEILDFITREVCSVDAIDSLFRECLDGDGFPLTKMKPTAELDMEKYVSQRPMSQDNDYF